MAAPKKWTENEDKILCEIWPKKTIKEVANLLGKTEDSVAWRASYLGVTKKKTYWLDSEREFVQDNMNNLSISEMANQLGRSQKSVRRYVGDLKILERMEISVDKSVIDRNVPFANSKSIQHRQILHSMEIGESYEFPEDERQTVNNQMKFFPDRVFRTKKIDEKTRRIWRLG